MGVLESFRDVPGDRKGVPQRQPAFDVEFGPEALARHQQHHVIRNQAATMGHRPRVE